MTALTETQITTERCLLIGLVTADQKRWHVEDHLSELESLARTAGAEIMNTFIQERPFPDPAYFIGKGKVEEISLYIEENDINLVIFDDELSPAQIRNLEKAFTIKVIDRTALILDIFADHAQTTTAKTQVELAQLNYLLPRLTRQWQHLSRQVGGIGTKGPGETQLETDRRLVRTRISKLESGLKRIARQGVTQRQNRKDTFRASLIGYTNAGKSTILNALSGANVLVEDKLFATLDTTVRRIVLDTDHALLLGDTVGFIRKLPHQLVASFRTTLAEVVESDLLIHVIDISHPNLDEHIDVVHRLLKELDLSQKPRLVIFNKVDLLKNDGIINQLKIRFPDALFISGKRHIGLKKLKQHFIDIIESGYETKEIKVDYSSCNAEYLLRPLANLFLKHADDKYQYFTLKYPIENKEKINAILSRFS